MTMLYLEALTERTLSARRASQDLCQPIQQRNTGGKLVLMRQIMRFRSDGTPVLVYKFYVIETMILFPDASPRLKRSKFELTAPNPPSTTSTSGS